LAFSSLLRRVIGRFAHSERFAIHRPACHYGCPRSHSTFNPDFNHYRFAGWRLLLGA
jgi:hypothetical protein